MVKEESKGNKKYFICEECRFEYKEKEWAKKCEEWCRKHHACNIELIKHAVS